MNPTMLFAIAALLGQAGEERRAWTESFDRAWSIVRDRHWDPRLGGVDWEGARRELRPRVERAATHAEARAVTRELLGRLGTSHFEVLPADADLHEDDSGSAVAGREGSLGLEVRSIEGRLLVVRVEEKSPGAAAGVRPGWEVVRIDGKAAAPARLFGRLGVRASLELRDGDDRLVERTLEFAPRRGRAVRSGDLPPRYLWFESRRLSQRAGYFAFSVWQDPEYLLGACDEALRSFAGAAGVVIDLRGTRGGLGPLAPALAGRFLEAAASLGTMTTRTGVVAWKATPVATPFRGRVAILTDGLTRSASEIFAAGLRDLGRARLFGARTAGAVAPSMTERLPDGDALQFAVARYVSVGGAELEGRGVAPDEEVLLTRAALLEGRDPVLERARAWIEVDGEQSVEEVLERWVRATGGREALERVRSRVSRGTITIQGLRGTYVCSEAAPGLRRTRMELGGFGTIEEGCDGQAAWMRSPLQEPVVARGADDRAQALFPRETKWREVWREPRVAGRETAGGADCWKVVAKSPEGLARVLFFDVGSGLLRRTVEAGSSAAGPVEVETLYEDHRRVDGLLLPHRIRRRAQGQEQRIVLDRIEHDAALPADRFRLPPAAEPPR
jgi:C-terminal processing protease CtpA/Prc